MEIVEFVKGKNAISVVAVGSVLILGTVIALNYDTIVLKYKDFTAKLKKNPVTSENPVQPTTIEDAGNFEDIYEEEQKDLKQKYNDIFDVPAETCVKNLGNVKKVNKKKVEGGEIIIARKFDFTKKKET